MKKYKILGEAIEDEIPKIKNPFTAGSDEAKGWDDALKKLANNLFGEPQPGQPGHAEEDPRKKKIPQKNRDEQDAQNDNKEQKNQTPNDKNIKKSLDDEHLNQNKIDELVKKIKQARDKLQDVIDDAGDIIKDKDASAEEKSDARNDLEKARALQKDVDNAEELANNPESIEDIEKANKEAARIKEIADFWDNPENKRHYEKDIKDRKASKELAKELQQARKNAHKRNYEYEPMTIDEIVRNIVNTLKNDYTTRRDSSWSRYNPRNSELGYIAPGRFTREVRKIPSVVFYFDISGSWYGDKEKLAMGHRIEESLKKLDSQEKIHLSCYYFDSDVHLKYGNYRGGNSDQPIPHALDLLSKDKLDNVIIMTDDNPNSNQILTVPGYAWLLFYDSVSESLATNVSGKKGTTIAMIEHDD